MRTVLFVCTGNTCRSPMAEAVAQLWMDAGGGGGEERLLAASAGIAAGNGALPTLEASRAMGALDLVVDGRSKRLTAEMVRGAEVVFGMTDAHVDAARELVRGHPEDEAKIQRLDPAGDLDDPLGQGQEVYDRLAQRLAALVPQRLEEVLSNEDRAGVGPSRR